MNRLHLVLYLMSLLDSVLNFLPPPAPVNVSVHSVNFRHILQWDPGPGTPQGTRYKISSINENKRKKLPTTRNTTALVLLANEDEIYLKVCAFYKGIKSLKCPEVRFTPFTDTKIGPPTLSLAGCGNCIKINISLPVPDKSSNITDMHSFYRPTYEILWKRSDREDRHTFTTVNNSSTLPSLEPGTEYCLQVLKTVVIVNKNTIPESPMECIFTSAVQKDPDIITVAVVIILIAGGLMSSMFCLFYTGFICKLKANLPRALITSLSKGYTLTPERTITDQISICSEVTRQRALHNPSTPQPASRGANLEEEEEDEEEEGGMNVYMNRAAEFSTGDNSCGDSGNSSGNSSGNRTLAASEDSCALTAEADAPDAEFEVARESLDEDETEAEGAEVCFIPEGDQVGVQGHATGEVVEEKEQEEDEEEEMCDSSGNVNLFSVTLGALHAKEQDTRDSLTDLFKQCDLKPLLFTDSQTEAGDQTTVALMMPTQEDFTETGYEGKRAEILPGCFKTCEGDTQDEETQEEEEEEEEEEEFSGYMRHT